MHTDKQTTPAPSDTTWRTTLERRVTDNLVREYELRTAPPEVIHRRVDGRTVLNRRFHNVRNPWLELEMEPRS